MNKIFKYDLPFKEKFKLELPFGAKIIRVEDVDGKFYLWAIVNIEENFPTESRYFECYKTGGEINTPLENLNYLGSLKLYIQMELCLYLFENVNPDL